MRKIDERIRAAAEEGELSMPELPPDKPRKSKYGWRAGDLVIHVPRRRKAKLKAKGAPRKKWKPKRKPVRAYDWIDALELSVRTSNVLRNEGVTFEELLEMSPKQFTQWRNFGRVCRNELVGALQRLRQASVSESFVEEFW